MRSDPNMLSMAKKEERAAYRLLIPTMVIILLIAVYPLGYVFSTSFTDKQFASHQETSFVGLSNYKQLMSVTIKELPPLINEGTGLQKKDDDTGKPLYEKAIRILPREPIRYKEYKQFNWFNHRYVIGASDPIFIDALKNTLSFTFVSVFLELILGLGIALVVSARFAGRGVVRAAMLIPWAVITVVSARIWEWMLSPSRVGLFNTVFSFFSIGDGRTAFLADENYQLISMIAVDVWKTTPFMALLLLAGLQLIPDDIYEAADIDGANKIRQFFTVTLPLLKPTIAVALVFRTLDALRVFDVFQILLGQSKYSLASYNYFQLIGNRNMGLASAIGVIIFILIFIFAFSYTKMLGVDSDEAR